MAKQSPGRLKTVAPAAKRFVKAAGGPTKVGNLLGTTRGNVNNWRYVPAIHVLKLEKCIPDRFKRCTRYDMRPDVFGPNPEEISAPNP